MNKKLNFIIVLIFLFFVSSCSIQPSIPKKEAENIAVEWGDRQLKLFYRGGIERYEYYKILPYNSKLEKGVWDVQLNVYNYQFIKAPDPVIAIVKVDSRTGDVLSESGAFVQRIISLTPSGILYPDGTLEIVRVREDGKEEVYDQFSGWHLRSQESNSVSGSDCKTYCQSECSKRADCSGSSGYEISGECRCQLKIVAEKNFEPVTVSLIAMGIILIGASLYVFKHGKLFKNWAQGLIVSGIVLSILGFISLFTTFTSKIYNALTTTEQPFFTLLEGYKLCNSLLGGIGSALSEDVLKTCRTVNMLFYLSVIVLILGIIFIVVGVTKKK